MAASTEISYDSTAVATPAGPRPEGQPGWNLQRTSAMPSWRYRPLADRLAVDLPDRTWPGRRLDRAPLWCPVDLRDGNQALVTPMDHARKQRLFELMVRMGFKEIEVSYPASSETDFRFVRWLIEEDVVPDDVSIVVLTPAREELIQRTFAALRGARRAIVHLYAATAPLWRRDVFGLDRAGLMRLIVGAAEDLARGAERADGDLRLQFSPETFSLTEPDYALEVCNAVTEVWQPTPDRPAIVNLPSTIESAPPNVFADQIERMSRGLERRSALVLSVHPHNDRGTGVAAAELAMLAGAERVEGCLFGNGERTGNVCLVTLALNLHSQGIDPQIDFSRIDDVRRTVEYANQLRVPERHPYVGELVYTSFSGTHQDAIHKVFAAREAVAAEQGISASELPWEVPYLPIDPHDVGRDFEAVIRVNSQSGKAGVAYLLKAERGLDLPRRLQSEFSQVIQAMSEGDGGEVPATEIWQAFTAEYGIGAATGALRLRSYRASSLEGGGEQLDVEVEIQGRPVQLRGAGTGPIDAFVAALATHGLGLEVLDYAEHALTSGEAASAAAYVECDFGDRVLWGVCIDHDIVRASLGAVVSAVNRAPQPLLRSLARR